MWSIKLWSVSKQVITKSVKLNFCLNNDTWSKQQTDVQFNNVPFVPIDKCIK